MKDDAGNIEDLELENEMLMTTVHELYELLKDLRFENKSLKHELEDIKNGRE